MCLYNNIKYRSIFLMLRRSRNIVPTLGLPVHTFDPHSPRSLCAPLAIVWLLLFLLRYPARAFAEEGGISPWSPPHPRPRTPEICNDPKRFFSVFNFHSITQNISYWLPCWVIRGGLYLPSPSSSSSSSSSNMKYPAGLMWEPAEILAICALK